MKFEEDELSQAEGEELDALTLLFGTGNMDPEYDVYLSELTSYSLERLSKEPANLREHAFQIKQQMQELAYTHYKSFIQTSNCIKSISNEVGQTMMETGMGGGLVPTLERVAQGCKDFALDAQSFVSLRLSHRKTLANHGLLLELLEIPQLMDTCVRNGCYEEALQLETFAKKLAKTFPNVTVVADIVAEVEEITMHLLGQLIHQLCTQIQFPVSLNAIGYLRRLSVYSEMEIRVLFLLCRDTWFLHSLSSIPDTIPYSYLNKLIDQSRTHLFDIINQYKAIFSDDSTSPDDPMRDGGLLYGWISQKVFNLIKTLESFLPQIGEGASINRLLDQSMSYGASLARVGVDVRGLVPPLFEKSIYSLFSSTVTSATHHFLEDIKSYQFPPPPSTPLSSSVPPGTSPLKTTKPAETQTPPLVLLDHPPLAVLTNAILAAFNELRQCAPLSLQAQLTTRMREALVDVVAAVHSLPNQSSLDTSQESSFSHLCKIVSENFLPYIVNCFHSIYAVPPHSPLIIDISPLVDSLSRLYATSLPEAPKTETTEEEEADDKKTETEIENQTSQLRTENNDAMMNGTEKDVNDTIEAVHAENALETV